MELVCTLGTLKATLEEHGVAILESVLNEEECGAMEDGMWDWVGHATSIWTTPVTRDPSTWREFVEKIQPKKGLVQHPYWVGHAQFAWDVRQNPKVVKVFETIWGTNDLVTSFDGWVLGLDPKVTNLGWGKGMPNLHIDQTEKCKDEAQCYQASITAHDQNEGDATFFVMPGSHKLHTAFVDECRANGVTVKGNWHKLTEGQKAFYMANGCKEPIRVVCPKGSMVLWDSRTVHCGVPPVKPKKVVVTKPKNRMVVFVCMQPRSRLSAANLKKKRKCFKEMRTTTHWPADRIKMFGKLPRLYGKKWPELVMSSPPVLSDLGRKLAGF